jgi:hypothetical protein
MPHAKPGTERWRSFVVCLVISLSFFFTALAQTRPIEWQGSISRENGVEVVRNPSTPLYRDAVLELQEEFTIKESDPGGRYLFVKPVSLLLDMKRNLYVLDLRAGHVLVFNEFGKYVRTIGKPGPGPGELEQPSAMAMCRDELAVYSSGDRRLAYFSLDGKHLRTVHSTAPLGQMRLDSKGNAFAIVDVPDEKRIYQTELQKFDRNLRYVRTLATYNWSPPQYFTAVATFELTPDDRVVYGNPESYECKIYDNEGTLLKRVQKKKPPTRIPREEIEYLKRNYSPLPGTTWEDLPKYYAPFYSIHLDDEGRVLFNTRAKMTGNKEMTWDVFDSDGRFLATINTKPLVDYLWANKRLYTVEENDKGFQIVKSYLIRWAFEHSD